MIWNKDSALRFVLDYLKGKLYTNVTIINRNMFGHALIKTDKGYFYFLFKKDFFHSFNYEFPEYIKQPNTFKGVGESINFEYLKLALNNNAVLLYCYQELKNAIYTPSQSKLASALSFVYPNANLSNTPSTALLKLYCDHYDLKRTQERTNQYKVSDYTNGTIEVNEMTYSLPFKLFERFKG